LERCVGDGERLITDAEVFQEILRRYRAIDRAAAIQPAFDALTAVVDEVLPIQAEDVERARAVLAGRWLLSARDALHVAIMQRYGVERILSFDRTFDQVPGIERVS
jgi:uncharacterized protein